MDALRTPDERFEGLPGWPYRPHYAELRDGLRVAWVDEGDGPVVLMLHGEPSWSYLYRSLIEVLVPAGFRCVAPDLVGFGRSDKPAQRSDYSYAAHVGWLRETVVEHLDLTDVTLLAQDWGGLLGLRVLAAEPDRFARVVVANTGLPTGDRTPTEAFLAWQRYSQESPTFHVGGIVRGGTAGGLTAEVVAAYDAPFPDDSYTAGARQFPLLVPTSPNDPAAADNRAAWDVLRRFDRPFLTAFSDRDAVTAGGERVFQREVPGAAGRAHVTVEGAGHFLQEDRGAELAHVVADFARSTGAGPRY